MTEIIGPMSKDGNTRVTTWAKSPYPGNYLVGGISDSPSFTEKVECAENGTGCAFLTNWSVETETFTQRWVWSAASNIREIVFDQDADPTEVSHFALVLDRPVAD